MVMTPLVEQSVVFNSLIRTIIYWASQWATGYSALTLPISINPKNCCVTVHFFTIEDNRIYFWRKISMAPTEASFQRAIRGRKQGIFRIFIRQRKKRLTCLKMLRSSCQTNLTLTRWLTRHHDLFCYFMKRKKTIKSSPLSSTLKKESYSEGKLYHVLVTKFAFISLTITIGYFKKASNIIQ